MNFYDEIKTQLINNEINRKVKNYSINRSDLNTYYNVGKMLSEAGKHYGKEIIKEYSKKLTTELNVSYSVRVLYKMVKYFNFMNNQKVPTVSAKLSWSHYDELLKINDYNKLSYYISIAESQNLSVRELRKRIKENEYERLDDKTKLKLINNEKESVVDLVKNPIIIKNTNNYEIISEKILQKLIIEDISSFLLELGNGFCYVKNEYKIKIKDKYNYIDLLLYNYIYKCFVVIELKVTELSSKHTGQIQNYMNYVDKNIRSIDDNKTVGIIICKKNNEYVIDYCSDRRIIAREYKIL